MENERKCSQLLHAYYPSWSSLNALFSQQINKIGTYFKLNIDDPVISIVIFYHIFSKVTTVINFVLLSSVSLSFVHFSVYLYTKYNVINFI